MRDENDELPGDFLHELYKWALECRFLNIYIFAILNLLKIYLLFSCGSCGARHSAGLCQPRGKRRIETDYRRDQHLLLDGGRGGAETARLAILQNQGVSRIYCSAGQFQRVCSILLFLYIIRFGEFKLYYSNQRLCMRHITIAIENMETNKNIPKDEEHISIIERIVQKTGNPKIAAVLALDLFLVGVDTVRMVVLIR